MNKYEKWYHAITQRGKSTEKTSGMETHHIIPECIGGLDITENRTNITTREHFICHWLLTKIYTSGRERHQVLKALWMMKAENPNQKRYGTKITSRVYAKLKKEYLALQSNKLKGIGNGFYGKNHTKEAKAKISAANKGRIQTKEEKDRQVQAITGRKRAPFSEEWKAKLSAASIGEANGMYGKKHAEETKEKMRTKAIGRKQSAETIKKKAEAIRGSKREKLLCPHCLQLIAVNTYPRWHGDNCAAKNP